MFAFFAAYSFQARSHPSACTIHRFHVQDKGIYSTLVASQNIWPLVHHYFVLLSFGQFEEFADRTWWRGFCKRLCWNFAANLENILTIISHFIRHML